ncbi:serine protease [Flagelloscypha sp. PMI_526]|nr:serine protease [Flagelloscypha sp. PMI_526]
MHFSTSFTVLALLVSSVLAAPAAPRKQVKKAEKTLNNRLIVTLKDGADRSAVLSDVGLVSAAIDDWEILNAFSRTTSPFVDALLAHDDVLEIEEDGVATIFATQTNAPWGLARLSSTSKLSGSASSLTFSYTYDDAAGSGVNVYIVDTGIRTTHTQFGGRASWGATFGGYANADGNGHGTHVAGTIGGSQYGVAKAVSLFAVKVLSDAGSGTFSDVISGINWAASQKAVTGRPTIISLSLGGSASTAVDSAVSSATGLGVHVVLLPSALRPLLMLVLLSPNYGSVVDIWAPGQDVISSYGTSDTATASLSGTSMATPHISGLAAYLISVSGDRTPAALSTYIQSLSLKSSGTVNYLAHNA